MHAEEARVTCPGDAGLFSFQTLSRMVENSFRKQYDRITCYRRVGVTIFTALPGLRCGTAQQ
jgi:hypothetical protein